MVTVAGIPNVVVRPTVEGEGTGGIGGGSDFTFMKIIAENPLHYWRMNSGAGGTVLDPQAGAGDNGFGPNNQANMLAAGGPGYAAETPMLAEPLTTSMNFEGTDDRLFGARNRWPVGTILCFFANQDDTNLRWLYGECNTSAITQLALRIRGDVNTQSLDLFISLSGAANFYSSTFDLGSALPIHPSYNMVAVRQPADGSGIDWFFNGIFYDAGDSEVTEATGGTIAGNVDVWLQSTADTGTAATASGIAARPVTVPDQFFDGLIFSVINTNSLWTDAAIENLWLQAVANGLP